MCSTKTAFSQRELAGAAEIKLALDRLNVCGTVLMIAAHPDDENTAVLADLARGRLVDTGYLSLTRGEGGQNLIGPEQGEKLGVIRTEELLDARHIDGARQFFSRAIDFGFSKTAQETLDKWGRERTLADIVWVIRKFRPDVVILRFSGTPRDGHGQHQSSAILGKEAFTAAADPRQFPEQLKWVEPWQAKRLVWNAFAFSREQEEETRRLPDRVEVDSGQYNPMLGFSYSEIAAMSRSMHRSQGMGVPLRKGSRMEYFVTVAGDKAKNDLFDGIDTTWGRVPDSSPAAALLSSAAKTFDPEHPERSVPPLIKARPLVAALKGLYAERKLRELDEAIALCAGVDVEATADHGSVVPGESLQITVSAIRRSAAPVQVKQIAWSGTAAAKPEPLAPAASLSDNVPWTAPVAWHVAENQQDTQPYWLREPRDGDVYRIASQELVGMPENPPLLSAVFTLDVTGTEIQLHRTIVNRFIDRVYGERVRSVAVIPPVALSVPANAFVFPNSQPKAIEIGVKANGGPRSGALRLLAPAGWKVSPESAPFQLAQAGDQADISFAVTPPADHSRAELKAVASVGGHDLDVTVDTIDYPHIPPQTLFAAASSQAVRTDVKTLAHSVGYIMGAGDDVPEALRQIGISTTLLSGEDLARSDLSRFDAVVTGVRAWNTRPDLRANIQRLYDYAAAGGTVVVQYNVLEGGFFGGDPKLLERVGPYPIEIGRERVTVEDAPVRFPNPGLILLKAPNEITERDFDGWVQERGLYFAAKWDKRYEPVLECHDPGEHPLEGGTLFARVGKGAYIFTAYSWFRELPAGVPGAYRIFANFVSAGKALQGAR
jgi:LmbE family N-acetylglucosaminyl deacetylase